MFGNLLAHRNRVRVAQLRTFFTFDGSASFDRNSQFNWIFGGLGDLKKFDGRPLLIFIFRCGSNKPLFVESGPILALGAPYGGHAH